ncbi:MAG TPA: hypothetical protein VFN07_06395 [Trueperaceae bacterium]|nr:hypothetical protein [Trueperaceae bacterium]
MNSYLRVHVANGYYDLTTPYYATLHAFAHAGLGAQQRANVSMSFYEAGHMIYVHHESLFKLRTELAKFVQDGTAE